MIHPDLIQTYTKLLTDGERYEVYPDACYLLSARLSPAIGVTEFEAILFTSPSPDSTGDDEGKIPLYVDTQGRPDDYRAGDGMGDAAVFCENGIYAVTDATTGGDDAYLQVRYVPRRQFCPAFPAPEQTLQECWDAAHNQGIDQSDPDYSPIYENFWSYERDTAEEDTGDAGLPGIGFGGAPL